MSEEPVVRIYGAHWCPDCRRCKTFLGEHSIPYEWIDILEKPEVTVELLEKTGGKRGLPTVEFHDGEIMLGPTNAELAQKLDLRLSMQRSFWPLIVIGGGPAGLTASIFTARDATETLVIEREAIGGNANFTGYLENVPGFPQPITGFEFSERLREQAELFGVEILQATNIESVKSENNYHTITTAEGDEYSCDALVIATGSRYRNLDIPGEQDFIGNGVHFCASCDGPFYKGQHVAVIGSGNSAAEAALELSTIANKVTMLVRGDTLKANSVCKDKVIERENISIQFNSQPQSFTGRKRLRAVDVLNRETGTEEKIRISGAFIFIGLEPNTHFLKDSDIELDPWGFIRTGYNIPQQNGHIGLYSERRPLIFETSIPGIFAAGDVREGSTKQVATAAGEGATAAMLVREYLKGVKFKI